MACQHPSHTASTANSATFYKRHSEYGGTNAALMKQIE